MKLMFTASSGGHMEEITCLLSVAKEHELIVVTESCIDKKSNEREHTYYLKQINRKEILFFLHFIGLFLKAFLILQREKPDCIISTGALVTYPFCLIAKLRGTKIIYIESFARVDYPSLTGKLMYPIADLFIIQWEEMRKFYPNAVFTGGVF